MVARGHDFDEISRAMGGMEAQMRLMNERMQEDRKTHDSRHRENTENLNLISGRVEALERTVEPLANTVSSMKPIVESILVTKWKLAGALASAGILITGVGWLIIQMVDRVGTWFFSHVSK